MTTPTASITPHLTARRSRLFIVRDVVVVALCALVVAGFLFDVGGGASVQRPAAASSAKLSS